MQSTTPALSLAIAFSLLLTCVDGSGRAQSPRSINAAPTCDTIAVPVTGLITLVAPGPNGVIAWTEGVRATEVRVRTAQGALRTVGRNGAGPGEFRIVNALGWHHDALWAYDTWLLRAQSFALGTTLLRAVQVSQPGRLVPRDDTSFIGLLRPATTPGPPIEIGSLPLTVGIVVPATGNTGTILSITPVKTTNASELPAYYPVAVIRGSLDASLWCATARGAEENTQLACATSGGTEVLRRQVHLAPHAISAALWDSSVSEFAEQMHASVGEVVKQFTRPRALTAAFDLLINGRSEIWLLRSPPAEATATWQRMTVTGRSLTPVSLPGRLQLRALDGDIAYAADTDTDGVQALVRCRLGLHDHGQ